MISVLTRTTCGHSIEALTGPDNRRQMFFANSIDFISVYCAFVPKILRNRLSEMSATTAKHIFEVKTTKIDNVIMKKSTKIGSYETWFIFLFSKTQYLYHVH